MKITLKDGSCKEYAESKAIIDIYNDTIKIVPSQMDPLPESNISLSNFDEVAYSVDTISSRAVVTAVQTAYEFVLEQGN